MADPQPTDKYANTNGINGHSDGVNGHANVHLDGHSSSKQQNAWEAPGTAAFDFRSMTAYHSILEGVSISQMLIPSTISC